MCLAVQERGPGLLGAAGRRFDAVGLRISQTVEGAILMARVASSPWRIHRSTSEFILGIWMPVMVENSVTGSGLEFHAAGRYS